VTKNKHYPTLGYVALSLYLDNFWSSSCVSAVNDPRSNKVQVCTNSQRMHLQNVCRYCLW